MVTSLVRNTDMCASLHLPAVHLLHDIGCLSFLVMKH